MTTPNPLLAGIEPVHPGEVLREDVLPALRRGKTEIARLLGISRQTLHDINAAVENIGARRLQTVIERVLDDISYTAPDRGGEQLVIDGAYVRNTIGELAHNTDLSRFIL